MVILTGGDSDSIREILLRSRDNYLFKKVEVFLVRTPGRDGEVNGVPPSLSYPDIINPPRSGVKRILMDRTEQNRTVGSSKKISSVPLP